jgi:hypothetical protein
VVRPQEPLRGVAPRRTAGGRHGIAGCGKRVF